MQPQHTRRFWTSCLSFLYLLCNARATPTLRCSVAASSSVALAGIESEKNASIRLEGCDDIEISTQKGAPSTPPAVEGDGLGVETGENSVETSFSFRVTGGDDGKAQEATPVWKKLRPKGHWAVLVESEVPETVYDAWFVMKNFGNCLLYGLEGLGANYRSLDSNGRKWLVELVNGEEITFVVKRTNERKLYHIVNIESHTENVFPGLDFSGSTLFLQIAEKSTDISVISFGWKGPFQGEADVAVIAISSLGETWLSNLERLFGESCTEERNLRTLEGDCNNLDDPKRGSAGHALRRMGGTDPSFPDGDPTRPSGPVEISPREVSNKLCAQSPGAAILEAKAEELKGQCIVHKTQEEEWHICPFGTSFWKGKDSSFKMGWQGYKTLRDGSLEFHFSGKKCTLELQLRCHGTPGILMQDDPCGKKGHVFHHPVACVIRPGEDEVLANSHDLTDLFWAFGQFVDHDLDLTPVTQLADKKQPGFSKNARSDDADELPIKVPKGDFFMEEAELEFERTTLLSDPRLGLHENQHSAYADLGQVYGVDYLRSRVLRTRSGGKLMVSEGNLPTYNRLEGPGALRAKVDNAPDAGDHLFVVGDIRGNENVLLLSLHTVWLREHNQICEELVEAFPEWTDEQLYQTARAIAIAEYQSIVYDEWLPFLLGEDACPSSDYAYDANLDPSIMAVFSTCAFRFGHSMVGSYLWKLGPGDRAEAKLEQVPLRRLFFKPEVIAKDGIDDYLRGAAWHRCKEFDVKLVDELRNFLFTEDETKGHMDLLALNLQRGRDMGLPMFNDLRELFGLEPYQHFSDFIQDPHLAASTDEVYKGQVNACDPLYCGFGETAKKGALVGETFYTILKQQFCDIRDADRFFYKGLQWDPELVAKYPRINDIMAGQVKLEHVIGRNTNISTREMGQRRSLMQL